MLLDFVHIKYRPFIHSNCNDFNDNFELLCDIDYIISNYVANKNILFFLIRALLFMGTIPLVF